MPDYDRRNSSSIRAFTDRAFEGSTMDKQTKHEILVLTLSTLAGVPIVAGMGFALVTGILAF
jgi:hypothetical protein